MIKQIPFCLLPTVFLFTAFSAEAQQPTKLPRIGYLTGNPFSNSPARTEALRQGLRELGYEEGKNILLSGARRKENSIASPRLRASS